MRVVKQTDSFLVCDDTLGPEQFADVWDYIQREDYAFVHSDGWRKAWRLSDGMPWRGRKAVLAGDSPSADTGEGEANFDVRTYPSGIGIDRVIGFILDYADEFAGLVGRRGPDWQRLTGMAHLYPQGTGLSWHADRNPYTGAYIYYAHLEWNSQWGGELFVADVPPTTERLNDAGPHLDNARQDAVLSDVGTGHYIMPKPNRLVILKKDAPHKIQRVDPAAGDRVRCTISGFFIGG